MTYPEALAILGLRDDDLDLKAIKRAYSQQLRQTRPEDDPEGFMALRQAYDFVKARVAFRQSQDENPHHDNVADGHSVSAHNIDDAAAHSHSDTIQSGRPARADDESPHQKMANHYSELIQAVLTDEDKRNDPTAWRALIRPRREESLDDWIIFDAVLRSHLIDIYNADIDRRRDQPEPVAPPKPLIEPSLAAGIFRGMDWDNSTEIDGPRHAQISWIENCMRINTTYAPKHRVPLAQPDRTQKLGLGPEIALGFVFVIIAFAMMLKFFGNQQIDAPRSNSSADVVETMYTQRNLEMLQLLLDNERENRLILVKSGELDSEREIAIHNRRTFLGVMSIRNAPGFSQSPMTFGTIRLAIGPAPDIDGVKEISPPIDIANETAELNETPALEGLRVIEVDQKLLVLKRDTPRLYNTILVKGRLYDFILSDDPAEIIEELTERPE